MHLLTSERVREAVTELTEANGASGGDGKRIKKWRDGKWESGSGREREKPSWQVRETLSDHTLKPLMDL